MIEKVFISQVDYSKKQIYHSVEKMLNVFLKDLFLVIFCIFSILLQNIHRMSNINNFPLFLI